MEVVSRIDVTRCLIFIAQFTVSKWVDIWIPISDNKITCT